MNLKKCSVCWEYIEKEFPFPLLDGENGVASKIVRVLCKCERKEADEREKKWEYEQKMVRISTLKNMSLMDNQLKKVTFDDIIVNEYNNNQVKICKRYTNKFNEMKRNKQGLILYGDVGTGKTYLSACIANKLLEEQKPVIMTSFAKLLNNVRDYQSQKDIMEKISNVSLVIMDDFGIERSSDYAFERMYEVVNTVYDFGIPLIITTNIDIKDMTSCKDIKLKRLYDRILERCYPVKFTGFSWRKNEAGRRYSEMKKILEEE